MVKLAESTECTGCSVCADVCAKSAIKIVKHADGFRFPSINNSLCVKCGLCSKVCPVINPPNGILEPKKTYAMKTLDEQLLKISSSGGIFGMLAKQVLFSGGIVFGCLVDENLKIKHSYVTDIKELPKLYGSKYVQSDTFGIFKSAKKFLDEGKTVLFSGTPCQILALKKYVGENYKNLITVDFICHGVPTPMLWEKYIDEFEKNGKTKVTAASFRDKTNGWKTYSMNLTREDGSQYIKRVTENEYLRAFVMDIATRLSCTNCIAKNNGYGSDITLGDFWGVDRYFPAVYDAMGVSVVLVNTETGIECINTIAKECVCEEISLGVIDKINPNRLHSVEKNKYRDYFINDLEKRGFASAYGRWLGNSFMSKVRRKIVSVMSRNKK